jgi:hypothetical protein
MAPPLTDEEVEALLAPHTRGITMPDGHRRPVTMMLVYWNAYDYLMRTTSCTDEWLAEIALEEEADTGCPFHICFPETVAHARKEIGICRGDFYEHRHSPQDQGAIQVSDQDKEAGADAAHILRGTPPANPFWQGRA